ncbi:hypothetical protein FHETE_4752 [Fusarium heterosporum]|uniref:F-box domain-containing protein n=1 Tax=Fusarium heterosporum TaxID=42747 RepID=A0A8H5WU14_FUSHE|nr:hypothetical protein FHETE_4752 [Fusarium heterosporum]
MASLGHMPYEILYQIFHSCSPQELCCLTYTCKRLELVAGTCLWSEIELHGDGYHELSSELSEPLPHKSRKPFYRSSKKTGWQSDISKRAERLFTLLQTLHARNEDRLIELTGRVRRLCTVIEPNLHPKQDEVLNLTSVWNLLPYFKNLESLELHGDFDTIKSSNVVSEIVAPPLTKLRFAKLFAYIPRHVATYILKSGTILERLELGILDEPISCEAGIDAEDDQNRDRWDANARGVIPRPLGDFYPQSPLSFPKLKHLYLCQPCNAHEDYYGQSDAWSMGSELASLESWKRVLLSSGQTLETLVLEQRPGAGVEENEGFSEEEFLNSGVTGAGSRVLVETLADTLLEETTFCKLKRVYLYGLVANPKLRKGLPQDTPADWLIQGLGERRISCEARRGKWCLFDQDTGKASWAKWDGDGTSNIYDGYMGICQYTLLAKD